MTDQEIEKLRENLGGDYSVKREGDLVAVELVDISKQIPQCIVTPIEIHSEYPDIVGDQHISIRMKIIHGHISKKNRKDVAYHLTKCLEDYLNKSQ